MCALGMVDSSQRHMGCIGCCLKKASTIQHRNYSNFRRTSYMLGQLDMGSEPLTAAAPGSE